MGSCAMCFQDHGIQFNTLFHRNPSNLSEFVAHALDIEQWNRNESYYKKRRTNRASRNQTQKGLTQMTPPQKRGDNKTKHEEKYPKKRDESRNKDYRQKSKGFVRSTKPL